MSDDWNKGIIEEFRANAGKVGGYFEGKPMLLIHTIGAKSGKSHINPTIYTTDGDKLIVIASNGGAPKHPDWYHNLVANPLVTVEMGTEQFQARAEVLPEPDRTRLYKQMITVMDSFAEYEQKTTRVIPVIALTRVK
jgi:deazaflavin-dependent oxidoreductase (nitroreductase family)